MSELSLVFCIILDADVYKRQPIITAKEYKKAQVKNLIKNVFDGSAQDLVASLFEEKAITDSDISELKAIFDSEE